MAALEAHTKGSSLAGVAAIAVSRTDVAPGPLPGELSLILHFGQARLDIRLELGRAHELGAALLEATSPEVQLPDGALSVGSRSVSPS
jgi:hypothetical protein